MAAPYVGIQTKWNECSINNCSEINLHIGVVLHRSIVHGRQKVSEKQSLGFEQSMLIKTKPGWDDWHECSYPELQT